MTLAEKYRPQQFEMVWGQRLAVLQLSRLVKARQQCHLLLTGAFGSGKTTLVRIFARGLNCQQLTNDGSPCNECGSCNEDGHLVEYDVPGRGGDRDIVRAWVEIHNREPWLSKWRVLFFDEAQALTPAAVDTLLKAIEEPEPRIVFAFATTEPWVLKNALRSRTLPLEVRPLSMPVAVDFLESIAVTESIFTERDALHLLASIKQGHPRDLLNGLAQVAGLGEGVTISAVKSLFAVHNAELLIEYFLALGEADAEREIAVMERWGEPLTSKMKAVQALLTSMFYNEIMGQKVVIDAFLDTLSSDRAKIMSAFCSRLAVSAPIDLVPYWTKMMEFWSLSHPIDHEALKLRFCLFENLVNRGLVLDRPAARESVAESNAEQSKQLSSVLYESAMDWREARPLQSSDRLGDQFLTPDDVREIVNRASFFMQQHGEIMNVAITIYPPWLTRSSEESAVETIKQSMAQLHDVSRQTNKPYGSVLSRGW